VVLFSLENLTTLKSGTLEADRASSEEFGQVLKNPIALQSAFRLLYGLIDSSRVLSILCRFCIEQRITLSDDTLSVSLRNCSNMSCDSVQLLLQLALSDSMYFM
jgi:hypothetical protein